MANLGLSSPILWPTPRRLLAPARRLYLSDTETDQSASLPGMALRTDPIPSRSSRDTGPGYVIGVALQHKACQKQRARIWRHHQLGAHLVEVALHPARRSLADGHHPVLLALALPHQERAALGVEVVDRQIQDFHPSDACRVEHFQNGSVPDSQWIARVRL